MKVVLRGVERLYSLNRIFVRVVEMLSFALPGQMLFTADTKRHCIFRGIVPIPSGLPVKNVIVRAVLQHSESSA